MPHAVPGYTRLHLVLLRNKRDKRIKELIKSASCAGVRSLMLGNRMVSPGFGTGSASRVPPT